jgi:hypothetical protein
MPVTESRSQKGVGLVPPPAKYSTRRHGLRLDQKSLDEPKAGFDIVGKRYFGCEEREEQTRPKRACWLLTTGPTLQAPQYSGVRAYRVNERKFQDPKRRPICVAGSAAFSGHSAVRSSPRHPRSAALLSAVSLRRHMPPPASPPSSHQPAVAPARHSGMTHP